MSDSADVVLVTPRSFARDDEPLRQQLSSAVARVEWHQQGGLDGARLGSLAAEADGWIAGVETIDREIIEQTSRLKVIARYGVGVDNVDLSAAQERGIVVTNTPGANAGAVAELVLGLMLSVARGIPQADRAVRAGRWEPSRGLALEGKVVGLLGLGAIGRAVARRVTALGCEVLAYDPAPLAAAAARELGVDLTSQTEVVGGADLLSLHLPLLPETRGMVDAGFLAAMKPGAILINAARGELVDEEALVRALRDGHLAGAALDALAVEPPAPGFELGSLDNVILTPHLGAHTDLAVREMGRRAVENCLAVLRGQSPSDPVNPQTRSSR
jgi:D-3-phosphoglycerate dehydrogenase